jgi:hypothetical protein
MPDRSHIHVRKMEVGDFDFVRETASHQPNFTVPSPYLLWLWRRIKGSISLVAEHSTAGPLAYLLAVPVEGPRHSVFVWQLASSEPGRRQNITLSLLIRLYEIAQSKGIKKIVFSARPRSAEFRAIRRYTWHLASVRPVLMTAIPPYIGMDESEYQITLDKR